MTARLVLLIQTGLAGTVLALLIPSLAAAQTARERYADAQAREATARGVLQESAGGPTEASPVAGEVRAIITAYEALVRRYPISGYSDNALFNAAGLADTLFQQSGQPRDLAAAVRLYRRVGAEYPASSLTGQATTALIRLEAAPPAAAVAPAPGAAAPTIDERPPLVPPTGHARLTSIDRAVLAGTVRITLALDREVAYREETLDGPPRVFFDLKGVELVPALMDTVLRYPSDAVRQIRVGRHPNRTVRVVLDLDGVKRHSVYTLYNPFRLVIDCEPKVFASGAAVVPIAPMMTAVATAPPAPTAPPAAAMPVPLPSSPAAVPSPAPPTVSQVPATPMPESAATNAAGGFSLARQLGLGISRIVIDPGHGGHDPGAQARGLSEAELTLDIALRLERLFLQEPGIDVVLTRKGNEYIPLEERTAIANREGADLFLSIHANTSRSSSARGVETYFLSFAASEDAEAVAARENSAHVGEMHRLPDIIKAIALNNKLDESRDLAGMVQEALVTRLRRSNKTLPNRGVKKAPFVVLIGAQMPSVLAEVSFLSNRQELQLLKTPAYKQRVAEALHAAVMRYRRSLKGASAVASK